jgi:very-short-patch-repair endonuclease
MTCAVYAKIWSSKNKKLPGEVAISSCKKYLFVCLKCKHEYEQTPNSKSYGSGCPYCYHKICGKLKCGICLPKSCYKYKDIWSCKNIKKSYEVSNINQTKYWFICNSCKHEHNQAPVTKSRGNMCVYCSREMICGFLECKFCLEYSCYKYINIWSEKNIKKPEAVAIRSGIKYLFNCDICNHEYEQTPDKKYIGRGCPFCSGNKICGALECLFCLEKSCHVYKDTWLDKNIKPEMVAISSNKKYLFKCKFCKEEYNQSPNNKTAGKGCPFCVNKTEQRLADFLREMNINFIREYKMGTSIKRYDFYLPNQELIIEVDGPQHFQQIMDWTSPEENLENDIKKMKVALAKGISVLRIYQPDIFSDKIDWKTCINDNFYKRATPTIVTFSSDPEIYNNHVI